MNACVMRWAVIVLSFALPALGQTADPESTVSPSPGSAISVPLPTSRQVDLRRYEIPELAGAEVAHGSFLVDGRLPRPVADYGVAMAQIRQRISIFENGIVSISLTGAGGTIRKKIVIPPDALEAYRKSLVAETLMDVPDDRAATSPNLDRASLRVYREDGSFVERTFNPTLLQGATLGKPLLILNDLLRALTEDREATNPLSGYMPRVGDQLVSDDEQTYRVVRILDNGNFVELMSTREPLTLYVAAKDLHNYFIGQRRSTRRDE